MPGSDPTRPVVVFVVGLGYSGSTLLDLLLGSHTRAVGLGELDRFFTFWGENKSCTCLAKARACPFWQGVLAHLADRGAHDPMARLYHAVATVAAADVVVDSSKRPEWARGWVRSGAIEPRIVHLVRDGRAVAWSHVRRGGGFDDAVRHWRRRSELILEWLGRDDAPPATTVHYEALAGDPSRALRRLCTFLGLSYEPDMLRFRQHPHHQVSGNEMRLTEVDEIVLDERWRQHLGPGHLARFERLAGATSRALGY